MQLFYSLGIRFYYLAILIASLFNAKAKAWISGRKNWKNKLPDTQSKNVIWFHCASLGEFDQGLPLMNLLKEKDPSIYLLVTFFSPSGMQHYHKRKNTIDFAMYLPIDTAKNAKSFIQHFRPQQVFFVKYEFWYFYIAEAKKRGILVYSVSTLLRKSQQYFKFYGGFFRRILKNIDFFFAQNQKTADLLKSIGIQKFKIVGDTRFDRVIENSLQAKDNKTIEAFLNGEKAIIFGSTWSIDEQNIFSYALNSLQQKFIIAPHDISDAHLTNIQIQLGNQAILYTQFDTSFEGNILILDTIGHLASAYKYGKIAYVGGGFTGKLHNILEPAVFGLPVLFGPKFDRFPEAQMFIDKGIGFSISDTVEFENKLVAIEKDLENLREKAKVVVQENQGASRKIIDFLFSKQIH